MKKAITLIIVLITFCAGYSQENEPNDTPDQADLLLFNIEMVGDISTTDVNDWYRFELEEGGLFELDIRKAEGNIIFWVYLHDGEIEGEPVIQQLRMFNNDTLLTLSHHLLVGTYYIRIGTATTLIPYNLTPRFAPNNWPDDIEPNNNESSAIQVLPNDEVTGNILYYEAGMGNDPQDWYVFDLEESGLMELEIQKSVLLNSEFTLYLRDGEKEGFPTIKQYRLFLNDSLHTMKQHLLKGKYYIQIGSPYIPNTYRLRTTFTPPVWVEDAEPNDDVETALTMHPNDTITGNIGYYKAGLGGDTKDWYQLVIDTAGYLEIEIQKEFLEGTEFTVYLYDGEKDPVTIINQKRLFQSEGLVFMNSYLLKGTYYVQVTGATAANNYQMVTVLTHPEWEEDLEPNDEVATALRMKPNDTITGTIAYYKAGLGGDAKDWYLLVIDTAGYLELEIQKERLEGTEFTVYLYDGEKDPITVINQKRLFQSEGLVFMNSHLLEGTYYVQVTGATAPNSYQMISTMTLPQWQEDAEPNDDVGTALTMLPKDTISGTVAYYNPGQGGDEKDWYKLVIDSVGLLELDIKKERVEGREISIYLYDGEMDPVHLINQKRLYHTEGQFTMRHHLLEGTYYVQVTGATAPHNYQIISNFSPPYWPEDVEPNNDTLNAIIVSLSDSITGNLYYYEAGAGYDTRDYYKFEVIEEGLMKWDIFKENNDAIFWVYLNDPNQEGNPQINQVRLFYNEFHAQFQNYLFPGTYLILIADPNMNLEYLIKPTFIPIPKADFSFTQVNNSILFKNRSVHGSEYLWDFGDGNQSNVGNPLHEYETPGVYDVCLIVSNEAGRDTICEQVIVKGLAAVYPNSGGNTGDVTLTVYGGGLDSNSIIIVEDMGEQLFYQDTIIQTGKDAIRGRLDLREKPIGLYDIVVVTGSGNRYVLNDAFTIEQGTRPDPWVEVSGRNRILFNTPSTYKVRYGNNGNVDASVVNIWLAFSDVPDMEIEFTGAAFISPEENLDSIIIDENPDPGNLYFTTDSVLGEPFQARVYPLIIPSITANTIEEFEIKIKTSKNIRIQSWANEAAFQSPFNVKTALCIAAIFTENFTSALPKLTDKEIECLLEKYAINFNIYYQIGRIFGNDEESGIDKVKDYFNRLRTLNKKTLVPHIKMIRNSLRTCTSLPPQSPEEAGRIVTNILVGQLLTKEKSLEVCLEPSCSDSAKSSTRNNNDDCPECGTYCPLNVCSTTITAVSSFDPNEKDQPQGYTLDNFTFYRKTIPYNIHFENVDSATAPAHTVRVVDVLDVDKFKLSSFQFGSVTIADTTVTPEKGSYQMLMDIDLNILNVVARVEATIDTLSGKVEWIIRSLDPLTFEEIEDPDLGFLPPNVSKPEGQGKVSFSIDLKEDLVNGEEVLNDAQIFFDANDPILTNVSSFVLDLGLPESTVTPLDVKTSDTLFQVQWSGNDDESGVRFYDIYVSEDDGEFERWRRRTSLTSDYFEGTDGKSYRFFSVAIDSVGNEEGFPASWDAETFITTSTNTIETLENAFNLFPNPCYGSLNVEIHLDKGEIVEWSIRNTIGTNLLYSKLPQFANSNHAFKVNLNHLPGGVYFLNVRVDDRYVTRKFVLINE